jgi:predicted ATP-grasp superfamily ATP-dependent carboligase
MKRDKGFEIEEFTVYWNVDEEKFKERVKNYGNILIAGFPPMGNIIPYHLKELLRDSEEILDLYSYDFPPVAEAHEEEFEIPHDEIWYSEEKRLANILRPNIFQKRRINRLRFWRISQKSFVLRSYIQWG